MISPRFAQNGIPNNFVLYASGPPFRFICDIPCSKSAAARNTRAFYTATALHCSISLLFHMCSKFWIHIVRNCSDKLFIFATFLFCVPLFVLYLLASNAYVIYIDSVTVDDVCHVVNKNFACKSGGFLFTVSQNFNSNHNSHFKRSEGTDSSKYLAVIKNYRMARLSMVLIHKTA